MKDAEPNTFVNFVLEHHGGLGIAGIGHIQLPIHGMGLTRETRYGSRLGPKREATLFFQIPENSDLTIVRVYAVSWEP